MSVISQKNKKNVVPVAEIIDQPPLKMQKTGDLADIETDHENAVPGLSDTDLQPLKAIYNAKARKKKYIRGRLANDVNWVYTKALTIDPEGTNSYISGRDEATVTEIATEAPAMTQTTPTVAPKQFKKQASMFESSDTQGHVAHMAIQNTYQKDGATKLAFKYASFPTLGDMVTYGECFPGDQPQCLFEMTREGTINAPFMDVDCTLDEPAPHLLVMIVTELVAFTQKHLGMTPRVVCTDSSRDKGGGRFKNSWHIILHDIGGFRNGATEQSKGGDMRRYFERFFESLHAPELKALDEETWDVSVCSKNSNMRCIGSHKADDESRTRLKPHDKYQGNQMSDYYVQQPDLDLITLPAEYSWPVSGKKTAKKRPKEPVITVSTSKVYSSERNEKRSVAQCIAAAETGSAHWQESFNDPQRLVKLYFDVDYTLPDDEVDIEQTYEKFRQEYPTAICNWLCADHSHNLELSHDDIAISDSSGMKDGNYHLSFHAVIQGYCCKFGDIKAVLLDHGLWDAKMHYRWIGPIVACTTATTCFV